MVVAVNVIEVVWRIGVFRTLCSRYITVIFDVIFDYYMVVYQYISSRSFGHFVISVAFFSPIARVCSYIALNVC